VKWAQLISADFSFKFSAFATFEPWGLLLWVFFFERSLSNVCRKHWLTKNYRGRFKNPFRCPEEWTQETGNQKQEFRDRVLRIETFCASKFDPATGVMKTGNWNKQIHSWKSHSSYSKRRPPHDVRPKHSRIDVHVLALLCPTLPLCSYACSISLYLVRRAVRLIACSLDSFPFLT